MNLRLERSKAMSKKYGKLLFGAAVLGAAAGAGLAYLSRYKKEKENWEDDFEDFEDDFQGDEDDKEDTESTASAREYVTIPKASEHETSEEESPVSDAETRKDTDDAKETEDVEEDTVPDAEPADDGSKTAESDEKTE